MEQEGAFGGPAVNALLSRRSGGGGLTRAGTMYDLQMSGAAQGLACAWLTWKGRPASLLYLILRALYFSSVFVFLAPPGPRFFRRRVKPVCHRVVHLKWPSRYTTFFCICHLLLLLSSSDILPRLNHHHKPSLFTRLSCMIPLPIDSCSSCLHLHALLPLPQAFGTASSSFLVVLSLFPLPCKELLSHTTPRDVRSQAW
jgi:hypothetical protein